MIVTGDSVNSMVDKVDEKKTEDSFVSHGSHGEPQTVSPDPKPFFIMDWLEKTTGVRSLKLIRFLNPLRSIRKGTDIIQQ